MLSVIVIFNILAYFIFWLYFNLLAFDSINGHKSPRAFGIKPALHNIAASTQLIPLNFIGSLLHEIRLDNARFLIQNSNLFSPTMRFGSVSPPDTASGFCSPHSPSEWIWKLFLIGCFELLFFCTKIKKDCVELYSKLMKQTDAHKRRLLVWFG